MPLSASARAQQAAQDLWRLHVQHALLTTRLADLLDNSGTEPLADVISECSKRLSTVIRQVGEHAENHLSVSATGWAATVLTVRVLDRSLALAAAVNATLKTTCLPFSSLLVDGARLMVELLARLRALTARNAKRVAASDRSLRASGPIVDAAVAGTSDYASVYDFGEVPATLLRPLLLGVAGDSLDLADDIADYLVAFNPKSTMAKRDAAADAWQRAAHPDTPPRREAWTCGPLWSRDQTADKLGITAAEVDALRERKAILSVRLWSGERVYPGVQLHDDTAGRFRTPDRLGELLGENVDFKRCSPWALAIWLGNTDDAGTGPLERVERLGDLNGLRVLCATLQEQGALRQDASQMPASAIPRFPSKERVEQARTRHASHFPGNQAAFEARWRPAAGAAAPAAPEPAVLFRLTERDYGAFNFTCAEGRGADEGSRFDLRVPDRGTCYFSDSAKGAFSEVFERMVVLDVQQCASFTLWQLVPFADQHDLLDVSTTSEASDFLNLGVSVAHSRDRGATQRLATHAFEAGYRGIVHNIRSHAASKGYALFANKGNSAPEFSDLGSWHVERRRTTAAPEFAQWVTQAAEDGGLKPFFNQIPVRKVLS
ncbi:MAG: RES family NAD+ phosphorylase [Nocardioides sp.]|uniref:RES family NAD+ phosphorylase n=1 Tax=Nocardioides sp. TaxID=35761 RepID=UPI00238581DD|nr:RES family NAD+ phosphorylase [Nocardioides sp.]MDE0777170.1 RES family NAD+ phosphorylase [Nocardioides sp.]